MRRFLLLFAAVFLSLAAFAETSTLTVLKPDDQTTFSQTTSEGITWTFNVTWKTSAPTSALGVDSSKGYQIGSKTYPATSVVVTSSGLSTANITSITVNTSGASSINATLGATVNGVTYQYNGTDTYPLTSTATDIKFEGSEAGEVTLTYSNTSTRAIYIKSITVEYTTGGGTETLAFDKSSVELTYGDTFTAPTLNHADGLTINWESSNTDVATVDGGNVSIVGIGTTKITATDASDNTNTASYTIKVNAKPHGLAYETTSYVVNAGETFTTPTLTNPNGLTVTYSSSNTDVATVDANTGDVTLTGVFGTTAITATATNSAEKHCTEGSATYTIRVKNPDANIYTDVLNIEKFGVTDGLTTYADYQYRSDITGILYFGNMAGGNSAIQMRHDPSKDASGIIIKANDCGLILKKVTVVWQSNTKSDRVLEVYGSNAPYTALSTIKAEMGTKLGEIAKETSTSYVLADADSYQYIALQSKTGALYLSSITLEWEGKVEPKFAADLTIAPDVNEKDANVITLSNVNISNGLAFDFTGYNVYLNDTELGGTDGSLAYLPFIPSGRLTISNGTYTYPIAVTWPDLAGITAKITNVKYWAWKDKEHLITDGKWYLDAEYTVAADTEMELAVEYEFTGNASGVGHVKTVTGNTAYVEGIGWFSVETETGADGKKYDLYKYYTDAAGDFKVTPKFPLFVKNALNDKFMAPEGTTRTVAIEGATLMVEVEKVAQQPDDTEDTGNISGVESVVVDSEGAVEYYNLQGVRVDGALTPGIYIRRTATGTSKVAIR
ncbi:MAG: Ig domain-containing protein [Muribaculaceae bacterium]